MHILFVGGGSVGHIAPSVAVWKACSAMMPDAACNFVCSRRPGDAAFLKNIDLPYVAFDAPRMSPMLLWKWFPAVRRAKKILEEKNPDVIFSKGGYVSVPLCYAAWKKGIPIVLHESDAVSGYANRIVRRFASAVCAGFPSLHFPLSVFHFTGNPVREEVTRGSRDKGLGITGLKGGRPILLVMGGSQGALEINRAVAAALPDLLLRCDVIHITGYGKRTVSDPHEGYFQIEFAGEELPHLYACADMALTRAGAGSIAELAACGIPSVLVPLRGVGHDHQWYNAVSAAKQGGCFHLEQQELSEKLLPTIHNLVTDDARRKEMAKSIRALSRPDAALQIAKIIALTLDSASRDH